MSDTIQKDNKADFQLHIDAIRASASALLQVIYSGALTEVSDKQLTDIAHARTLVQGVLTSD